MITYPHWIDFYYVTRPLTSDNAILRGVPCSPAFRTPNEARGFLRDLGHADAYVMKHGFDIDEADRDKKEAAIFEADTAPIICYHIEKASDGARCSS